jgi:hypothetical protein
MNLMSAIGNGAPKPTAVLGGAWKSNSLSQDAEQNSLQSSIASPYNKAPLNDRTFRQIHLAGQFL